MRTLLVLAVALAVLAAACGDDAEPTPTTTRTSTTTAATTPTTTVPTPPPANVELARAEVDRVTAPDVTAVEIVDLVAGNEAFAYDLFAIAAADGTNTLISPYSVAAALTMTYAGARGDTAAEMRDVLHLGLGGDRIHAARNGLDLLIATTPPPLGEEDTREPFTIRIANSLWGQAGYPFLEDFLTLLAENYDAGMNLVDFQTAAEEARVTINAWVEGQTEGRIVDLIPEGVIDGLTRLVLVNAIWFKANWAEQFDAERTADGAFTTLAGQDVTVPLMRSNGKLGYAEGDGYQAVRLPYAGDAAMVVVLPAAGRFTEVANRLGPELIAEIRDGLGEHQVELALPRFEFRSEFALKPALQQLGMVAAFVEPSMPGGADLTAMTEARELFVKEVVHQAFIAVDEEGTEAAAATAVIISLESAAPPATFTVDRPFLFVIEHNQTGEPLFVGQVTDPAQS